MPILVARQSFSDDLLRRVSSGTDLWFQASEDPNPDFNPHPNQVSEGPNPKPSPSPSPSPNPHPNPNQVSEGRGSRVLLRTSMVRSLVRSPRECMETTLTLTLTLTLTSHLSPSPSPSP